MPHGYLKNASGESRKKARGGGSHRTKQGKSSGNRNKHGKKCQDVLCEELWLCGEDPLLCIKAEEDFPRGSAKTDRPCKPRTAATLPVMDCPICFESKPVVQLMKVCSWHEDACMDCMRQVYVTQAQKAARNFPLRCFHPQCRRPIRETQLLKHNLFRTEQEVEQHHRLTELVRGEQAGFSAVHCPYCDHPRAYRQPQSNNTENGGKVQNRFFTCRKCSRNFMVSPYAEIVRAIENNGQNTVSFAQCPSCGMLITRDGDDGGDVYCFCGASFGWDEAKKKSGFRYPFGRPSALDPYDVLYLHW